MIVRPARAIDVYQFAYFDTPDAEPHVVEVEQWVRQLAWAWFRDPVEDEDRRLLVGDEGGEVVAISAHALVAPAARYLMIVAVQHDHRGQGLGRTLFERTTEEMRERTPRCAVYGLVATDNEVMRRLAESLGASRGGDQHGYLTYRTPPER